MDRRRELAWFSAVNPELGLLLAYVWRREDFPWLGNWEESYCRLTPPWNGKTLSRGMEFANSPFPLPLREQVGMGSFQGVPAFRWLGAKSAVVIEYAITAMPVPEECRGTADIRPGPGGYHIDLVV
ncbi:MAG: hypothetical protein R6V03_04725 [Kiritimatiellia bacterium]